MPTHLQRHRNGVYRARVYVPTDLVEGLGKREIVRSLYTESRSLAGHRLLLLAVHFDSVFNMARTYCNNARFGARDYAYFDELISTHVPDPRTLDGTYRPALPPTQAPLRALNSRRTITLDAASGETLPERPRGRTAPLADLSGLSLRDLTRKFIDDNKECWAQRTLVKHTFQLEAACNYFGEYTPPELVDIKAVRAFRATLRKLPRDYTKLFPGKSLAEIADAPESAELPKLKPGSINPYLGSLRSMFAFAVNADLIRISQNPASNQQVKDPERKRDKRNPFSVAQLKLVFAATPYGAGAGVRIRRHGSSGKELARYSEYVTNGMSLYVPRWVNNGWQTSDKCPVANAKLWKSIVALTAKKQVVWTFVRTGTDKILEDLRSFLIRVCQSAAGKRESVSENGTIIWGLQKA